MSFFKWIRSLSLVKQICVGMATVLTVGGSATTVAVVANHKPQKPQVVVTTEESSIEEPKSEEEQVEEAIHFSSMKISASSIEKDLDIFFLDENNKKIKGQPFSVKLVAVKDAEKLNSYVQKINNLNKEIKEAEDIVSGSTAASAASSKPATAASKPSSSAPSSAASSSAQPSSSSTGLLVADARLEAQKKLVELGKQKVEALDEYKDALKEIKGTVYTDDNQDGRITQKKLEPGDFSLCYVPTNDYDAAEFTQKTTVKDKVEYKPVVNIEEKKVTVEEAGDAAPQHEVVEESKPKDTVEYVEPDKKGDTGEYKESTAKPLASIGGGSSNITKGITYDEGTVLYSDVSGANSASFAVSPPNGGQILGAYSDVDGVEAKYENGSVQVTANGYTGSGNGADKVPIRIKVKGISQTNDPSTDGNGEAQTGNEEGEETQTPATSNQVQTGSSEAGGSQAPSSETPSSQIPSSEVPSSQAQTPASSQAPVSQAPSEYEVEVYVYIHGTAEQLKDKEGRLLFKDDQGKQPATIGDYDPNEKYFYEFKKAGEVTYYGWQTINGLQYYFDKNGKKVTGPQVILGVRYNFGTDGALITNGMGIDVSKWQGDINWAEAKSAVSFAIIRAGFRGTAGGIAEDPYAAANIKGCNANGIRCGLYFYSRATTEAEAVEEASLAIAVAKKGNISLPIYFDMESPENKSADDKDALVMAFCKTVQAAGYKAGLYASKNWINNYLNPNSYGGISIWVAQYADSCTYGGHYDMWQYTSKGSVPGISGNVDMNKSSF